MTVQEKAICSDPGLSKLDEDTAAAYNKLRSELSAPSAADVRQDQRAWLQWLEKSCADVNGQGRGVSGCLTNAYSEQLRMFNEGFQRVGAITFFPRLKVVTTPDAQKPQAGSMDPGFGQGGSAGRRSISPRQSNTRGT